ncbi:hypothetical protein KFE25_000688 [Diacronema lutheri]|uniref:WW domain-containing protein n=1 Tax=Diacronema lutheri TaxID=2081491 RepID=A0A8J5XS28_DIALT|nr:hypothetical protein KFE25_000688 [Diacronema lutheri]
MASARRVRSAALETDEWTAYSSHEHNGRMFWLHASTGQRTWAQPLPRIVHVRDALANSEHARQLVSSATIGAEFEQICWVCTEPFGSDAVSSKTISGDAPLPEDILRAMELIAPEFASYPLPFASKAGLDRIIFCSRLHYDGQRRGHVPSFHSRAMYIDCMAQPKRRVVSSFHHELWHFADYTMLGRDYEFADAEWLSLNPAGFTYGKGGAAMRSEDTTSGYIGSANSDAFLNRYSTASAAEDKAEVWAALLTDMQLVETSPTLQRKRDVLKARAGSLLAAMCSAELWERIRSAQLSARRGEGDWETYMTDAGRPWWFNRVTHEKRWDAPEQHFVLRHQAVRRARQSSQSHAAAGLELAPTHAGTSVESARTLPAAVDDRVERTSSTSTSEPALAKRPKLLCCFSACFPCLASPQVEHAESV